MSRWLVLIMILPTRGNVRCNDNARTRYDRGDYCRIHLLCPSLCASLILTILGKWRGVLWNQRVWVTTKFTRRASETLISQSALPPVRVQHMVPRLLGQKYSDQNSDFGFARAV